MPLGCSNNSGCSAHAIASSPPSRLLAGVFSSSSLMQKTRRSRTAGRFCQFRCSTIFSSGTRSPAPHHAARSTSGCADAISSAVVVFPGSPTNSPPAASTSSATQGCEAIIGLPHSSQKTVCLAAADVSLPHFFNAGAHARDNPLPRFAGSHHTGDRGDVGIDVGKGSRSETKKTDARLQNLGNRFQLIRNRRQHQIRFGGDDLFGLRRPGVGDDDARSVTDLGTDIHAIFRAGDETIQQPKIAQRYGRAGL